MNETKDAFIKTLTNTGLWAAIIATISIIFIGYLLTRLSVLKKEWKPALVKVVMNIAVPALVLKGFMATATIQALKEQGIVLGVSFAFYIVLSIAATVWIKYWPNFVAKISKNKIVNPDGSASEKRALMMWMMLIFGSTTFFGLPIINSLYPNDGTIAANIWNIGYRVFLYSYAYMMVAGIKLDKKNLKNSMKQTFINPIVICTFLGLILWLTTLIPGASSFGKNFSKGINGWYDWKVTMPYLFKTFAVLGGLAAPITWIAIGITLASSNLKKAAKDVWVWTFCAEKLILIPLIVFLVFYGLNASALVSKEVATAMVIYAAVPPATMVVLYAMKFNVREEFASQCSALATLLAVITLPIWVIISNIAFK